MQSQIEYELDVLKSGNYDHALQFIEHLVNILVRMKNALTDNEKVSNRVPQQEDDNFWGYTFNFIAKVVDFELDATGQFHECTYGTHNEIAHNHNITNDDSAIYFACATSPISNSLTDVAETGYLKPTQAQLDWLKKYKDQMSPTQREMLNIE